MAFVDYERIKKFKERSDLNYVDKNELDTACFAHDAAYANSKDSAKRTVSGKILKGRVYEIALNPKYDGCQRAFATMMSKFFDKNIGSGLQMKSRLAADLV